MNYLVRSLCCFRNIKFILVLIVIYISNDTSLFGTNESAYYITINRGILYGLCGISLLYLLNQNKLLRYYTLLFGVFLCMLLTIIANYNFSGGYIQQFMMIIIGLYFIEKFSFQEFCFYFEKVVYSLSIIGLIFFILNIILGGLQAPLYVTNSHGAGFSHFFVWANLNNGLDVFRNTSIFREPGIYMIYIIFALLINIYVIETNIKRFAILLVSLISTLSTAGIIIGCIVLWLYFNRLKFSKRYSIYLFLIILLVSVLPFIEQTEYFLNVMGKFNPDNDSYASFVARQSSIFVPLKMAQSNIFGVGFSAFPNIYESVSYKMYGTPMDIGNSTNSITNMIARFGWLWGVFYIKLVYNLSNMISLRSSYKWVVFLVICLCFFNEDIWNSYIFSIFILFGLKRHYYEKNTYNLSKSNNR